MIKKEGKLRAIASFCSRPHVALALLFLWCALLVPRPALANIAKGTCGKCKWTIDDDGVLTIEAGKLASNDRDSTKFWPWFDYSHEITSVVLREGVELSGSLCCMFRNCYYLESFDASDWDTSSVTDMSRMFEGCFYLPSLSISRWDTSSVTNMSKMFYECEKLKTLDVSGWDTSSVTNMSEMFVRCQKLVALYASDWDTSSVKDMSWMFNNCRELQSLEITGWDTSSVENAHGMFFGCMKLASLDVSGWDTSSVVDMGNVFDGCSKLSSLDVSNWDTSSVTNMNNVFSGCKALKALDTSDWDTSSVKKMSKVFEDCTNLESLDVSGWDTSNVTSMSGVFLGCAKLTSLDVSNWDTSSVTYMELVFKKCSKLASLDVSCWNTSSVTSMRRMFDYCSSLVTLDLAGWDTSSVADMESMFSDCSKLASIDLTGWDTSNVTGANGMFSGCTSLERWRVGSGYSINSSDMVPNATATTDEWWSVADQAWYSKAEIEESRSLVADTYTSTEVSSTDPQNPGQQGTDISKASVYINDTHYTDNPRVTWTGSPIEPDVRVQFDPRIGVDLDDEVSPSVVLQRDVDYAVSFANNTDVGTATCTITGIGDYTGSKVVSFEIVMENESAKRYRPSRDGWGFDNYADDEAIPEDLFYRVYARGHFLNWKTYLLHKNGAKGGLCEGLALSSALTFMGLPSLASWGTGSIERAADFRSVNLSLVSPAIDYTLDEYIKALWLYQFSLDSSRQAKLHRNKYDDLVQAVERFSSTGSDPIAIVINTWEWETMELPNGKELPVKWSESGHVLIPYAMQRLGNEDLVYVYDCNAVGLGESPDEQYVELVKDESGRYTGWRYQLWPGKEWGTGVSQLASITYLTDLDEVFRDVTAGGGSSTSANSSLENHALYTVGSADFQVTDCEGNVVTCANGAFDGEGESGIIPVYEASGSSGDGSACVSFYSESGGVTFSGLANDALIGEYVDDGGVEVRATPGATVRIETEDGGRAIEVEQGQGSRFEVVRYEGTGGDDTSQVSLFGTGTGTARILDSDGGTEVVGVSELVVRDDEGRAVHAVGLDEGEAYSILPSGQGVEPTVGGGDVHTAPLVDITAATVSGVVDKAYTGGEVTQSLTVTLGGKTLDEGWDYEVSYEDNVDIGTARLTVAGRGIYTGTVVATFRIVSATTWERLYGNGRYDTMAAIVQAGFAKSEWAVVATGKEFPDALVAASLAGAKGCPVVLTAPTSLSKQARSELERLGVRNAYVMGGKGAVDETVMSALGDMGIAAERVAGPSRMGTSLETLEKIDELGRFDGTVVVATGYNFADALSIGPWCYRTATPMLLTNKSGRLSNDQVEACKGKVRRAIIVGGDAAVSDEVVTQLGLKASDARRLAGSTRFATSKMIAEWETGEQGMAMAKVAVATGDNFPDALAGAALCGTNASPLLLVRNEKSATLELVNKSAGIKTGYVLGGEGAVSAAIMSKLESLTK